MSPPVFSKFEEPALSKNKAYLPPRSVKFNKEKLMLRKFIVKIGVRQDHDAVVHVGCEGTLDKEDGG